MGTPVGQSHPYFRGSQVDYTWSARFALEHPSSLGDTVLDWLGDLVTSFGAPDIPRCKEIAGKITETLGWERHPGGLPEMRIIGTPNELMDDKIVLHPDKATETLRQQFVESFGGWWVTKNG
jgi:hypothetical protein